MKKIEEMDSASTEDLFKDIDYSDRFNQKSAE